MITGLNGIDHVGVVTSDVDAVRRLAVLLGLTVEQHEQVPEIRGEILWIRVGDLRIEVLSPTGPTGPVARALEAGRHGVDHIALRVEDCAAALASAREAGATALDAAPREGAGGSRIAFLDPDAHGGLRIELVEPSGAVRTPRA